MTKKGFTLVELIVVITILAILGTVGYLSFSGYSKDARDTTRASDLKLIEDSIVLSLTKRGVVPEPTNSVLITYKGGTLFKQGTFGRSSFDNVGRLNKVPLDPLFENEYTFSISSTRRAYQIGAILEGTQVEVSLPDLTNNTYAAVTTETVPYIRGSYNGQIVHTSTGGVVYIVAIPSIILSDTSDTNVLNVGNKIIFNGEAGVPESYLSADIPIVGSFSFQPVLLYSGATLPRTPTSLKPLVVKLQDSFLGTNLFSHEDYQDMLTIDVDNADELQLYGINYINKKLGGRFESRYFTTCKEILGDASSNQGSGLYTISPDGNSKIEVYCDMEMDGGGWTRINAYDYTINDYTDQKLTSKTRGIGGNEVVSIYTRAGAANTGKKFGIYYDTFEITQYDELGNCGTHTTISDLASHITGGTRGNCARSRDSTGGGSRQANPLEEINIQVDDLGGAPGIKTWTGFTDDSCVIDGHKTTDRNVHWDSTGLIEHRMDSTTTIISLGGRGYYHNYCNGNNPGVGIQVVEVYVR